MKVDQVLLEPVALGKENGKQNFVMCVGRYCFLLERYKKKKMSHKYLDGFQAEIKINTEGEELGGHQRVGKTTSRPAAIGNKVENAFM